MDSEKLNTTKPGKIILKRGRPKSKEVKEKNHKRGRIPQKNDKYSVTYEGITAGYKTINDINKVFGLSNATIYRVIHGKTNIEDFSIAAI